MLFADAGPENVLEARMLTFQARLRRASHERTMLEFSLALAVVVFKLWSVASHITRHSMGGLVGHDHFTGTIRGRVGSNVISLGKGFVGTTSCSECLFGNRIKSPDSYRTLACSWCGQHHACIEPHFALGSVHYPCVVMLQMIG